MRTLTNVIPLAPRLGRRAAAAGSLGRCPACTRAVYADGHAIRLHGDFFHADCALYQRDGRRRIS